MTLISIPETLTAILPISRNRATPHSYSHSKKEVRNDVEGIAHYYRCGITGVLRCWGFDTVIE